jgi:hypothetical protein
MLTNSKIALSVALVLATASAAVADADGPSDWIGCWGLLTSERCNPRSEHIGHCVAQSLQRAYAVFPGPVWCRGSRCSTDAWGRHIMSRREYRHLVDGCEHADASHPAALLRPRRERP